YALLRKAELESCRAAGAAGSVRAAGPPGILPAQETAMDAATMEQLSYPISDLDPFSVDYIMDPFDDHERLRNMGPVIWLDKYKVWFLPRHEQVHAVLSNPKVFCSSKGL